MLQTPDKGGRTTAAATVRKSMRRVLNGSAFQLAESVLAKALAGDTAAQRTAVEMLKMANAPATK